MSDYFKLACLADLHVGNHNALRSGGELELSMNRRCRQVVETVKRAMEKADELDCTDIAIAGDIFDTCKPSPQMLAAMQDALKISPFRKHVIPGNHDMSSGEPGDHALGPLRPQIELYEEPTVFQLGWDKESVLFMPYESGKVTDWLPERLDEYLSKGGKIDVLVAHFGIRDGSEPAFMAKTESSILDKDLVKMLKPWKVKHVIAGDWHFRKNWQCGGINLIQCGTLAPTGWDNPGMDGHGSLWTYDGQRWELHVIPGPRFLVADGLKDAGILHQAADLQKQGYFMHVRWTLPRAQIEEAAPAASAAEEAGVWVSILPDGADLKSATRRAGLAARKAGSSDEALSKYVDKMDLKEGLSRENILARCRRLLAPGA